MDNIVKKYNNTVQKTIRTKPIDVTDDSYAEYNEHSNNKNPRFKVGDYVRISKYENIFAILLIAHKKFLLLIQLKKQSRGLYFDIGIFYLGYEYKKKITECNEINSKNKK